MHHLHIRIIYVVFLIAISLIHAKGNLPIEESEKADCQLLRKQADRDYADLNYTDAILKYQKIIHKGCATISDKRNLGICLFEFKRTSESERLFYEVVKSTEATPEDIFIHRFLNTMKNIPMLING